jgi:hypothetical protein
MAGLAKLAPVLKRGEYGLLENVICRMHVANDSSGDGHNPQPFAQ